jgi:hypothetical protein
VGVTIREVPDAETAADLFREITQIVYRNDRNYRAPLRATVLAGYRREELRGAQRILAAFDGSRPVATLVAMRSPALRDDEGRPLGLLATFEALDHPDGVDALFASAIDRLRGDGTGEVVGPMAGDTWHGYRLNVGPFDRPPFLMEPYNPAYYPRLWARNGFQVLQGYHSKRVEDVEGMLASLAPKLERAREVGYRFEPFRSDAFETELARVYEMSREVFRDNFLYSEIPRESFLEQYAGARGLIVPELLQFAVAPDGTDAGFVFAFPDRVDGGEGAVNVKSLGVVAAHRGAGLAGALMYLGCRAGRDRGLARANLCLIADGNPSSRLDAGFGTLLRRYHLYRLDDEAAP